jgi:hypothetical protein
MIDRELVHTILLEIDSLLKSGVLPVSVDHLKNLSREADVLEYLIAMKSEGLISGDLITIGINSTPHRMTNIRLTYLGIRSLRRQPDDKLWSAKE